MPRADLSNYDASRRAGNELEVVLQKVGAESAPTVPRVAVEDAIAHPRLVTHQTSRNVTRVLFITQETDLLNPETQSLDGLLKLSELFAEVHILLLREGIPSKDPVLRVSDTVWLYTATARAWWGLPQAGLDMVKAQLVFAAGFRPDLIIVRDAYESALVALWIQKHFNRPMQLHILDDEARTQERLQHSWVRRFLPRFTIKKFLSIRTSTETLQQAIQKKFQPVDIATLPQFHDYQAIAKASPVVDLKTIYPPYVFVILYVGSLSHTSTAYRAIDAARGVLQNPRIGLVILGDGPARPEFEKRTKILQLERQVVFERRAVDRLSYLKSAQLLVVTDTDEASEELVKEAAAVGIPMILANTPKRADLFTHGDSAWLCEPNDTMAFTAGIDELLNNFGLRQQFSMLAKIALEEKFHQNPAQYEAAFRDSLEQAMFIEAIEDSAGEDAES